MASQRPLKAWLLALATTAGLLGVAQVASAEDLPVALQAVLLKKVLNYDRTLAQKKLKLAVVHKASEASAAEVVKAFEEVGITSEVVTLAKLPGASATVAYLVADATTPEAQAACKSAGILAVGGVEATADSGLVAVAVTKRADGRPGIVINLPAVQASGHDLSSDLLKLARVVH